MTRSEHWTEVNKKLSLFAPFRKLIIFDPLLNELGYKRVLSLYSLRRSDFPLQIAYNEQFFLQIVFFS